MSGWSGSGRFEDETAGVAAVTPEVHLTRCGVSYGCGDWWLVIAVSIRGIYAADTRKNTVELYWYLPLLVR